MNDQAVLAFELYINCNVNDSANMSHYNLKKGHYNIMQISEKNSCE